MKDERFDVAKTATELVAYCASQMRAIGGELAVVGISGGKDSSVTAALMAAAIGADKVHGLLMPDGHQADIDDAHALCAHLGIHEHLIPIGEITKAFLNELEAHEEVSRQTRLNLPPRVRMTMLYGFAQSLSKAMVINTSNLSEDWVGYATLYGDTAGAFSPLGMLTSEEVSQIGKHLGLPRFLADKTPADGLTGQTDEAVLGFSYAVLNRYIRTGEIEDQEAKERIDRMHRQSRFKFLPLPLFNPRLSIRADDTANVYGRGDK